MNRTQRRLLDDIAVTPWWVAAAPAAFSATQDVDAILPLGWLEAEEQNLDFWEAQQKTNAELEGAGLYITHLFRAAQPKVLALVGRSTD